MKKDELGRIASSLLDLKTTRSSVLLPSQGPCFEIKRSISLFCAITKTLAYIAILTLAATNDYQVHSLLQISYQDDHTMFHIPKGVRIIAVGLIIHICAVTICGIFGYARLDRNFIFYYGVALVLTMLAFASASICLVLRNNIDIPRKNLYLKVRNTGDIASQRAVETLENYYQCCGSKYYTPENVPMSCCQNISSTGNCTEWAKPCDLTRATLYSVIMETDLYIVTYAVIAFMVLTAFEAYLSFSMVHVLSLETDHLARGSIVGFGR